MRVLGIESASVTASAAILTDDILTAEYTTNFRCTHSETLLPMIDAICTMTQTEVSSLDCIAVSSGPGSFTGLRIGSATGKGLGLALDIPIVSVPTLQALAYNMAGTDHTVCAMMDARRGNVYAGVYQLNGDSIEAVLDSALLSVEEIFDRLRDLPDGALLVGDGAVLYREKIANELGEKYKVVPAPMVTPRAASVAALGMRLYTQGKAVNAREHVPNYLRPSQAERNRTDK